MIKFDSKNNYFKSPFGAVEKNTEIFFRIQISRRIATMKVSIIFYGERELRFPLSFSGADGIYEEYSSDIIIETEGLYFYRFEVEDTENNIISVGKGPDGKAELTSDPQCWKLTVYENTFTDIEGFWGKNIYQIFPDRFCKGEKLNIGKHGNIRAWGDTPNYIRNPDGTLDNSDFFGGSFEGIQSKLEYLYSLGIDIIYLNPIFESASNHRYDTGDYEKTDSMLGTNDDFTRLCQKAKEYGIKIIIDGVFSHTGADSKYFNKYGNYPNIGAYQSEKSDYSSWFKFIRHPDEYKCWWDVKILPETNEEDPSYLSYITGENGIAKKWIRLGASGWRLDVADELPDLFLERFRNAVKSEKPDALIIGEVWENAADKISYDRRRKYLHGHQLDSVMNYVFRDAVISFMQDGDSYKLNSTITEICEDYPAPILNSLMNFLGTHDTERIKTVLGSEELVCLAYALLSFLPGLPTIYYGDEVGMEGGKDPLNRLCFPWNEEKKPLTDIFTKINKIRHSLDCVKNGTFNPVVVEKDLFGFYRTSKEEKCLFLINISDEKKFSENVFDDGIDIFSGRTFQKQNGIDAKSFIAIKYPC